MRSKLRTVLVAFAAVFAFAAVATASASAHEFRVEGKALTGEEAFKGSSATAKFVWTLGITQLSFECTKEAASGKLQTEGKFSTGRLHFSGCVKVGGAAGCELQPMEWTVLAKLGGLGVEFTGANPGEELAKFTISGGSCSLANTYSLTGHFSCELHEESVEAVEHEVICKNVGSHLKVGTETATIAYKEKVKLTSGKKWSAV